MSLIARRREHRAKMAHTRHRTAELLPLCEKTMGARLEMPFKIECSSRMRHAWRYAFDRLSGALGHSNPDTCQYLASKELHQRLLGYFDSRRWVLGVNASLYIPGHPTSEYTLVHEIMHALFEQGTVSGCIYEGLSPRTCRMLGEGAANFYGGRLMQALAPGFSLQPLISLYPSFATGYIFFCKVAAALGDPLEVLKDNPPREWPVWMHEDCRIDSDVCRPEEYIRRVEHRSLKSPRPS